MSEVAKQLRIVFVRYGGTENGVTKQDTTACADSLASMIANSVVIVNPFPPEFVATIPQGRDPSRYDT